MCFVLTFTLYFSHCGDTIPVSRPWRRTGSTFHGLLCRGKSDLFGHVLIFIAISSLAHFSGFFYPPFYEIIGRRQKRKLWRLFWSILIDRWTPLPLWSSKTRKNKIISVVVSLTDTNNSWMQNLNERFRLKKACSTLAYLPVALKLEIDIYIYI